MIGQRGGKRRGRQEETIFNEGKTAKRTLESGRFAGKLTANESRAAFRGKKRPKDIHTDLAGGLLEKIDDHPYQHQTTSSGMCAYPNVPLFVYRPHGFI